MNVPLKVPFVKAHGAGNDFLYTWAGDLEAELDEPRCSQLARAICDRHTGVGSDGWYLIDLVEGAHARLSLWNSDGSKAELSGNGTRCAAALLLAQDRAGSPVRIMTGSGLRELTLKERRNESSLLEMDLGAPVVKPGDLPRRLAGVDAVILEVGNPQCAVKMDTLEMDWKALGAELEGHPYFPKRTNVSFFRKLDEHTIEARFYERGAGATKSSGTGATGAAVAAILLGEVRGPVTVRTEGEPLVVRWPWAEGSSFHGEQPIEGWGSVYLTGPAQITAQGIYFWLW